MTDKKIFKENHIYGHVLNFLYDHADESYSQDRIADKFKTVNFHYLLKVLGWLESDELIVKEDLKTQNVNLETGQSVEKVVHLYRISYKGFTFINQLRNQRKTLTSSHRALFASITAIVISIIAIFHDSCVKVPIDAATANQTKPLCIPNVNADSGNVKNTHRRIIGDSVEKDSNSKE